MQTQKVTNISVSTYTPPFVATMRPTMAKKIKLKPALKPKEQGMIITHKGTVVSVQEP